MFENIEDAINTINKESNKNEHNDENKEGKVCDEIINVRRCNGLITSCIHSDSLLWKNEDHFYKSYVFDDMDICPGCYQESIKFSEQCEEVALVINDDVKVGGDDDDRKLTRDEILDYETLMERQNFRCEYRSKDCTPLNFVNGGWYWSRLTRKNCCSFHHNARLAAPAEDEKLRPAPATYEKIDKTTFYKFLFRVNFSDNVFTNYNTQSSFLLLSPTTTSSSLRLPDVFSGKNILSLNTMKKVERKLECLTRENIAKKILETLSYINAGNDYYTKQGFHPEFKSLYAWVPFDQDLREEEDEENILTIHQDDDSGWGKKVDVKILKHYALVYCDSNDKELFGQVAVAIMAETVDHKDEKDEKDEKSDKENNCETFVDMTNINIDEYLERKYKLTNRIAEILDHNIRLPWPLIDIVVQYFEENDFIKNLRLSAGFKF
jgi:hypothetical protein